MQAARFQPLIRSFRVSEAKTRRNGSINNAQFRGFSDSQTFK